jgi:hypothetical protein
MNPLGKILIAARMFLDGVGAIDLSRTRPIATAAMVNVAKPRTINPFSYFIPFRSLTTLLFLLCCVVAAYSEEHQLSGWITRTIYTTSGSGNKAQMARYEFDIIVSGHLWKMRAVQPDGPYDYEEAGTDGTNVYLVVNFKRKIEQQKREGKKVGENIAVGTIIPGIIPREVDTFAIPALWLGFASGNFFKTNTMAQSPDIFSTGSKNPYTFSLLKPALWKLNNYPPFLPKSLISYEEGTVDWWDNPSVGPWTKAPVKGYLPAPYDKGYTNYVFQVSSFTNLNGHAYPEHFEIFRYLPQFEDSSGSLRMINKIECRLTDIKVVRSSEGMRPVIPGITLCADYRYALADDPILQSIDYQVEKNWRTDADVKASPAFQRQIRSRNQLLFSVSNSEMLGKSNSSNARRYVLIVLIISSAVTLGWLVKQKIKKL